MGAIARKRMCGEAARFPCGATWVTPDPLVPVLQSFPSMPGFFVLDRVRSQAFHFILRGGLRHVAEHGLDLEEFLEAEPAPLAAIAGLLVAAESRGSVAA